MGICASMTARSATRMGVVMRSRADESTELSKSRVLLLKNRTLVMFSGAVLKFDGTSSTRATTKMEMTDTEEMDAVKLFVQVPKSIERRSKTVESEL